MLSLCTDLQTQISKHVNDKEKIAISMISKEMDKLKYIFTYVDEVSFEKIQNLSYFDNFMCVRLDKIFPSGQHNILPLNCKYIHIMHNDTDIPLFQTSDGKKVEIKHISFSGMFDGRIEFKMDHTCFAQDAYLTFGYGYNCSFSTIPSNVTSLDFGSTFCRQINPFTIAYVKYIKFGTRFDQPIDFSSLKYLTHLIFGLCFNQQIHKCLPTSLIYLEFGMMFNQSIYESIPSSVTHLIFGDSFSYSIYRKIPQSVIHLTLGKRYLCQIDDIPPTVTHLTIKYQNYNHRLVNIPSTVTQLMINNKKFY